MRSIAGAAFRCRRPLQAAATTALSALATSLLAVAAPASSAPAPTRDSERADLLMVVDCLLPGQVRTLGQRTTYLSARRPARLPARDCQIRGGEYVAYDRADLKSALGAWLEQAEQGDQEARVIVGEIYERGIGVTPDYEAAARWYRLAADADSKRAQINLGYLYEQGLGVPADPAAALDWYRRAAGRDMTIELDATPQAAPDRAEEEQLRLRTRELEQSLERLRAELQSSLIALQASETRTAAAEVAAAAAAERLAATPPPAPVVAPTPDSTAEIDALQRELAGRARDAEMLRLALDSARVENDDRLRQLENATVSTTQARAAIANERQRLTEATARLAQRESELAAQRNESTRLGKELADAVTIASTRAAEIQRLEKPVAAGLMAGPELALVEPQLTATRDIVPIASVAGTEKRIVGRVTAPAGLVVLTVNDQPVETNEFGVFSTTLPITAGELPVLVAAVDRQGKRGKLRFRLRAIAATPGAAPAQVANVKAAAAPRVDFGNYYALIIGNNDYRTLPDLASPVNDATDLANLLQRRYGFKTTVLINADRYQILSALNTLRESLTANDNLLIYYAGHGELDEVNQRGHWLPVDAERDSTANWIPTTAVTDIINIMRAKQVMLVVDSCYAGALTRSSVARLGTGMTEAERLHWLRTMATRRSRTALTSGGLSPVMDAGGGRHSVFAKALLEVLEDNADTLDGQRLHREVAARVAYAAANLRFDQVPEYAPIRFAGHEAGEFFLVPRS